MPRAPRIEYEDSAYHVMVRDTRPQLIAHSNADRCLFAETLAKAYTSHEALIYTKGLTIFIFYAFVP